jgi:ParB/RepB/Spo0J family partition protein
MEVELHRLELKYAALRIARPTAERRLLASLAAEGQQQPVLVVTSGEREPVLIDGYRRVAALQTLGRDTVEAMALSLSEAEALMWRHRQEGTGRCSALEDAWLVAELLEGHGLAQVQIARCLGRSESWISRRLALLRVLPEPAQLLVRRGQVPAHGAQKHLVPLARAKKSDCERLCRSLGKRAVTSRELGRLYAAWRAGDAEVRARLVERPALFLDATAEQSQSTPPSPAEALLADLATLAGICQRTCRRLRESPACPPCRRTRVAWQAARAAFDTLNELMEPIPDAGSGHSDRHPAPAP